MIYEEVPMRAPPPCWPRISRRAIAVADLHKRLKAHAGTAARRPSTQNVVVADSFDIVDDVRVWDALTDETRRGANDGARKKRAWCRMVHAGGGALA